MRKRLRKWIRRLVVWALADEPTTVINWHINKDSFIHGASTPEGRKVIVSAIKTAKTNREL